MLLCDALLCDALDVKLLSLAQFANQWAQALGICNHGVANVDVRPICPHQQVARVDLHYLVGCATCVESKSYAAFAARLVAVAVTRVQHLIGAARVEGNKTEAMRDELVGEDGGVGSKVHEIDSDSGDLGLDNTTKRVGEGEINVVQLEVHMDRIGL